MMILAIVNHRRDHCHHFLKGVIAQRTQRTTLKTEHHENADSSVVPRESLSLAISSSGRFDEMISPSPNSMSSLGWGGNKIVISPSPSSMSSLRSLTDQ
ncbi:hypothetical protein HanXRQr2_Chr04g0188171 [Helianthus annuus]|uniref:Uncharacterized protein n=1 Tax=Helianthus annuus TaxID=4232 RepID=A0A251V2M4_HELAN|nr:hypothetical protein HanXRQr2_Chr04g0188171 [Helianthus annuus]KAJ0590919.1 hypothetical protein HanIR_Chr04g0202771 [Helianthus annuus]KAJ0598622.1 hypothetical protein HanHA89_Chr04g0167801 [Helianthus annuus]KAJ0762871.1 hypothetical protein HanOQP8_Chr04g0166051 [Helianthus annuus]